jgi:hypothetical protein
MWGGGRGGMGVGLKVLVFVALGEGFCGEGMMFHVQGVNNL